MDGDVVKSFYKVDPREVGASGELRRELLDVRHWVPVLDGARVESAVVST